MLQCGRGGNKMEITGKEIALIIAAFLFGLAAITFAGRPTDCESYNSAIRACDVSKDYQTCVVAVNSGYTRILKKDLKKDEN